MMIPIRIRYRVYPNAPKATRKSIILGVLTNWAFLLMGCITVHSVVGASILNEGLGFSQTVSNILALAADGFFVYEMLRIKNRLSAKLDREAVLEAAERVTESRPDPAL